MHFIITASISAFHSQDALWKGCTSFPTIVSPLPSSQQPQVCQFSALTAQSVQYVLGQWIHKHQTKVSGFVWDWGLRSCRSVCEVTEQAIHLRTTLLILVSSVEWSDTSHYPLKGHRQDKEVVKGEGQVYLAWSTRHTGLQGKDQENLTEVLWQQLWPLYTTTMFVHVYTRSLIKDKRDYCYWSSRA